MKQIKKHRVPLYVYYLIVLTVVILLNVLVFPKLMSQTHVENVDYGTFLTMLDHKQIETVQMEQDRIYFIDTAEPPGYYVTNTFDDPNLVDRLYGSGCNFDRVVEEEMHPLLSFAVTFILPIATFVVIGQLLSRSMTRHMGGAGGAMAFGKSNAKVYVPSETGIHFSDVAGEEEAKEALSEIVDFLHNPK